MTCEAATPAGALITASLLTPSAPISLETGARLAAMSSSAGAKCFMTALMAGSKP